MKKLSKDQFLIIVTICLFALVFLGFLTKFYSLCEAKNGVMIKNIFGIYQCVKKENINE